MPRAGKRRCQLWLAPFIKRRQNCFCVVRASEGINRCLVLRRIRIVLFASLFVCVFVEREEVCASVVVCLGALGEWVSLICPCLCVLAEVFVCEVNSLWVVYCVRTFLCVNQYSSLLYMCVCVQKKTQYSFSWAFSGRVSLCMKDASLCVHVYEWGAGEYKYHSWFSHWLCVGT